MAKQENLLDAPTQTEYLASERVFEELLERNHHCRFLQFDETSIVIEDAARSGEEVPLIIVRKISADGEVLESYGLWSGGLQVTYQKFGEEERTPILDLGKFESLVPTEFCLSEDGSSNICVDNFPAGAQEEFKSLDAKVYEAARTAKINAVESEFSGPRR